MCVTLKNAMGGQDMRSKYAISPATYTVFELRAHKAPEIYHICCVTKVRHEFEESMVIATKFGGDGGRKYHWSEVCMPSQFSSDVEATETVGL